MVRQFPRDVRLPGWDLEDAIREKINEKLGRLTGAAIDRPTGSAEARALLDRMEASIDFDVFPWNLENIALAADGVQANGAGTFDPVEGLVDVRFTSQLSKARTASLVSKHSELEILVDRQGRIVLPMRIKGSMMSPSIQVELGDVLSESVKTKVKDKARKLLKGLLDRD